MKSRLQKAEWRFGKYLETADLNSLRKMVYWEFARESPRIISQIESLGDIITKLQKLLLNSGIRISPASILRNVFLTGGWWPVPCNKSEPMKDLHAQLFEGIQKCSKELGAYCISLLSCTHFPGYSWRSAIKEAPDIESVELDLPSSKASNSELEGFLLSKQGLAKDLFEPTREACARVLFGDVELPVIQFLKKQGLPLSCEVNLLWVRSTGAKSLNGDSAQCALEICREIAASQIGQLVSVRCVKGTFFYESLSVEFENSLSVGEEDCGYVFVTPLITPENIHLLFDALRIALDDGKAEASLSALLDGNERVLRQMLKDLGAFRARKAGLTLDDLEAARKLSKKRLNAEKWNPYYDNLKEWNKRAAMVPRHFRKVFPLVKELFHT